MPVVQLDCASESSVLPDFGDGVEGPGFVIAKFATANMGRVYSDENSGLSKHAHRAECLTPTRAIQPGEHC
jgi:hypothetical protein